MRESAHGTLSKTRICAYGKATASTMFMIKTALKKLFTRPQQSQLFNLYLRAITPQFWLMGRLEQVKLTLWRVLSTTEVTLVEVSCQGQWKRFFTIFRCSRIRTLLLWFVPAIYKFTTRSFPTCSKWRGPAFKLGRTKRKVSSWRDFLSGLSEVPMRSTASFKEVLCPEPQQRQK